MAHRSTGPLMTFCILVVALLWCPRSGTAQAPTYTVVAVEPSHYANVRRFGVRIVVPKGLSEQEVRSTVETVALAQMKQRRANAVMVFAFGPNDNTAGAYTVARAIAAPYGDWAKAGEAGPIQVTISLERAYFEQSAPSFVGKRIQLKAATRVSKGFESWYDTDIIATLPAGTTVSVLEIRRDGLVVRYRITGTRDGRKITGWVHHFDVE